MISMISMIPMIWNAATITSIDDLVHVQQLLIQSFTCEPWWIWQCKRWSVGQRWNKLVASVATRPPHSAICHSVKIIVSRKAKNGQYLKLCPFKIGFTWRWSYTGVSSWIFQAIADGWWLMADGWYYASCQRILEKQEKYPLCYWQWHWQKTHHCMQSTLVQIYSADCFLLTTW